MKLATLNDLEEINKIFKPYLKEVFPYLRKDYIIRKIGQGNVLIEDGVVIIFGKYVKKQHIGKTFAKKGDAYICEIASSKGNAKFVLNKFFDWINANVWLTVRKDNTKACSFYERNGMKSVSEISWKNGTIPGIVYFKKEES